MNPAAYDASPSTFSSYPFLLEIRGVYPNTRIDQNTFRANITGTNVRGKWNVWRSTHTLSIIQISRVSQPCKHVNLITFSGDRVLIVSNTSRLAVGDMIQITAQDVNGTLISYLYGNVPTNSYGVRRIFQCTQALINE